jgi:serine/threonine protein kinase
MVLRPLDQPLIVLVLYSARSKLWKLIDLRCNSVDDLDPNYRTVMGRGLAGYRAPEMIGAEDRPKFSAKTNIWALGCLLYEILTRKRAFKGDYDVYRYAVTQTELEVPDLSTVGTQGPFLYQAIMEMLRRDPKLRPTARDLLQRFYFRAQVLFGGRVAPEAYVEANLSHNIKAGPVGDFLLESCQELMSKLWDELESRRITGPDAERVTGGDTGLECPFMIGGGGQGKVYEVLPSSSEDITN